ncbi:MAG: hypothetical protein PVJ44_17400, partial [Desulfobacterales bacterium]
LVQDGKVFSIEAHLKKTPSLLLPVIGILEESYRLAELVLGFNKGPGALNRAPGATRRWAYFLV